MSTPNPQPPLKRGSGATDTEPVTRPELAYMLDGLQASLQKSNKSAVEACVSAFGETQAADFNNSIETAIVKYDGMQQARFREMDSKIDRVHEKNDEHKKKTDDEIAEIRKQIALCEKNAISPAELLSEEFSRAAIPQILRVGSPHGELTRAQLETALSPWLADVPNIGQPVLAGPDLGRNWTLQFQGPAIVAAKNARRANMALKDENGNWTKLYATTSKGDRVEIFIGSDESPKMRAQTRMGKRFLKAVAEVPFLADSYFVKSESAIYTKGKIPYAIMQAESKDSEDILWDPGFVEEHNINKQDILESFLSLGRRKLDSIQWAK